MCYSLKGLRVRSVFVSSLQSNKMVALILAEMCSLENSVSCLNATQGGQRRRANLGPRQEAD